MARLEYTTKARPASSTSTCGSSVLWKWPCSSATSASAALASAALMRAVRSRLAWSFTYSVTKPCVEPSETAGMRTEKLNFSRNAGGIM